MPWMPMAFQRFLDVIQLERFDNGFNFFHHGHSSCFHSARFTRFQRARFTVHGAIQADPFHFPLPTRRPPVSALVA